MLRSVVTTSVARRDVVARRTLLDCCRVVSCIHSNPPLCAWPPKVRAWAALLQRAVGDRSLSCRSTLSPAASSSLDGARSAFHSVRQLATWPGVPARGCVCRSVAAGCGALVATAFIATPPLVVSPVPAAACSFLHTWCAVRLRAAPTLAPAAGAALCARCRLIAPRTRARVARRYVVALFMLTFSYKRKCDATRTTKLKVTLQNTR